MAESVELDTGFLADRSLIDVSDGLCLPWISDHFYSKLLEKTRVTENACESDYDSNGHFPVLYAAARNVC